MKRSLIFALLICAVGSMKSQQDPQYTQWMFDKLSFNPAAAGMGDMHCVTLLFREQWNNFPSNPHTSLFNYSGYFHALHGGIGLTFNHDRLGQERNNIFRLAYAFHANVNDAKFSAGLAVGSYAKSFGNNWVAVDDWRSDKAIANKTGVKNTDSSLDLNLGLMYYKPGSYYVGLSTTHLTGQDLDEINIEIARHYYFMGGYNFDAGSDFKIRTNLLAKSDFNASIFDINANVLWNEMVWAGASFRPGDAIAPMAGFQYGFSSGADGQVGTKMDQKVMLGYSYDVTTSEIKNFSDGSQEIFLTYCLKWSTVHPQNRHANPRFL